MSDYSTTDLEAYVKKRAPEIARDIRAAADKAHNEADLVAEVEDLLEKFAQNFDVQLNLQRERTLINGRADAVYNRFVIEYEPPHSLRKMPGAATNKHAVDQVKNYMEGLERLDRHRKERLAGVALDGSFYIFVRFRDDHWHEDDPVEVTPHSTETFLRYLLSLATELALTPENLVRDFGENSNVARRVVPVLYESLTLKASPKTNVLFEQWRLQFREVSGFNPDSSQIHASDIARSYAVQDRKADIEKLFFCIHTYYASFIKLLALQVAHYYLMPKVGSGLRAMANEGFENLKSSLVRLEGGGLFKDLGICNFLEGDFFGWYLDAYDEKIYSAYQRLIGDLANYSLVTLDVDPEETRDLLKQLYQNLMPKKLRHDLGEYYTPDWLAERLLNQLGYEGDPSKRLLDPACGSGTFLVLAIKRVHEFAQNKMLPPEKVLDNILKNIVGFDLNPLAVMSARTNYLLSLGELLQYRGGDISIPVYLCDSILTPSQGQDLFSQNIFSFKTSVGVFSIPRSLVQAHYIDQLADLLENCVHNQVDTKVFKSRLIHAFPLISNSNEMEISISLDLFQYLVDLEKKGVNGIWARIIKNAFAPLFQGQFDYIAGNPPWVNWENLPEEYRQETAPYWQKHVLFSHKGFDAILGKSKDDISVLMTYVCIDQYLKKYGRLGFVITQSVFKSSGAGKGFRRFMLHNDIPLRILSVDDMSNIRPFGNAANRTAIFLIEKGKEMKYPMRSYNLWFKPGGGTTIPEGLTLDEITSKRIASYYHHWAQPVDRKDITSSWVSGRSSAIQSLDKIVGSSDYTARAGVSTWLNGVFWLEVLEQIDENHILVRNLIESSKKELDSIQSIIELDLVYPLLRMGDIQKWSISDNLRKILVTHKNGEGLNAIAKENMALNYPKTFAYLKYFENQLRNRSGFKRFFTDNDPFYSIFNIGDYTFSPYKVVWPNIGSEINAAVISNMDGKTIIPQHIITLIGLDEEKEANFICAVLNSSIFNFAVMSFSQKGGKSFGTPQILENIRVPLFNNSNSIHQRLSELSSLANLMVREDNLEEIISIEEEVDSLVASLYKIDKTGLEEIKKNLEEIL